MKFPKSLHAEGWANHLETTKPEHLPPGLKSTAPTRPAMRAELPRTASMATPGVTPQPIPSITPQPTPSVAASGFSAAPAPLHASARPAATAPRSGVNPWLIGAGVGAALIGLAVAVSRNLAPSEPSAPPTTVVGQASTSPEDAQLRNEPPSAGPATPVPEAPAPAAEPPAVTTPAPAATPEPPRAVAAAPAEAKGPAPALIRAAPTSPASRLTPPPEALAQATPRESALVPVAPVVPPAPANPAPATPPAAVPPETVPPVAQAQPQPPTPAVNPEDAGITQNVRVALASDATLAGVPIVVSTDHGVVKLEGQAPDAQSRERATVVAAGTSGVKAVDNRLTLPPVATVGQAPSNL